MFANCRSESSFLSIDFDDIVLEFRSVSLHFIENFNVSEVFVKSGESKSNALKFGVFSILLFILVAVA